MRVGTKISEPVSYTYRKIQQFHERFWKEYDKEYVQHFAYPSAKSCLGKDAHMPSAFLKRQDKKYVQADNLSELSISNVDSYIGNMQKSFAEEQNRNFKKDKETQKKQTYLFSSQTQNVITPQAQIIKQSQISGAELSIDEYMNLNSSKQSIIQPIKDGDRHDFQKEDVQDFILLQEKEEKKECNDCFENKSQSILRLIRESSSSSSEKEDSEEEQRVLVEKRYKDNGRGEQEKERSEMVNKQLIEKKESGLPNCSQQFRKFNIVGQQISLGNYRAKVQAIQQDFMLSLDSTFQSISSYITSLEAKRMSFSSQVEKIDRKEPEEQVQQLYKCQNMAEGQAPQQYPPLTGIAIQTKEQVFSKTNLNRTDLNRTDLNRTNLNKTNLNRTNLSQVPRARDHYSSSQQKESCEEDEIEDNV